MVVMFDQSKFFDRIEANLLLRRMRDNGIPKNVIVKIGHILAKRKMCVKITDEYSESRDLSNGRPLGLSISLLISAIYENRLKSFTRNI